MAEVGAGEMSVPATPVPVIPRAAIHATVHISVPVGVHHRMAVLKAEMAAAHMETGGHATAVKSAAARICIAPREQNAGDADGNDGCNRSEQHGCSIHKRRTSPIRLSIVAPRVTICDACGSETRAMVN